jgi:hypothetical protein
MTQSDKKKFEQQLNNDSSFLSDFHLFTCLTLSISSSALLNFSQQKWALQRRFERRQKMSLLFLSV